MTNVMGAVRLLASVLRIDNVRAVLNVTTVKCCESSGGLWGYRVDKAMGCHNPYSYSNGSSELVTVAHHRSVLQSSDTVVASAGVGNVLDGGGWTRDRRIPGILRTFACHSPAHICKPAAIRPWQHGLEPWSGYLMLAQRLWHEGIALAEAWSFGRLDDDARPVHWTGEHLVNRWGSGASWHLDGYPQPNEAPHLKLDIAKSRQGLSRHPRWPLDTALHQITD